MTTKTISSLRQSVLSLSCTSDFESKKLQIVSLLDSMMSEDGAKPQQFYEGATHQKLSARERQVFDMMLSGHRLKEIAAQLNISVKTVTTHRARLLKKLNLEDNLGLYRYGIRNGLISA